MTKFAACSLTLLILKIFKMVLDFSQKATPITLEGLRHSIVEKLPNGETVGGISHINFIEDVLEIFSKEGIDAEITDLFAANNRVRWQRPRISKATAMRKEIGTGKDCSRNRCRAMGWGS